MSLSQPSGDLVDGQHRLTGALLGGEAQRFATWPSLSVPHVAAGVYTIWRGDEFIYVGMAGRGESGEKLADLRARGAKKKALWSRLNSHASGRRSGDQFCVYVCDCFVLPALSREQILNVAAAALSLDALTREYIRGHLSYRFVETADGTAASRLEAIMRNGSRTGGLKPLLNPA